MAEKSLIAWTTNTFNPWMGCTKVSPGCTHCYAETLTTNRMGLSLWGPNGRRQVTSDSNWRKPIAWNREASKTGERAKVFCASLCDIFENHPIAEATRPRLWDLIRRTPNLDWQLLTKRADRIRECLPDDWGDGYPNVWLGVSVESQDYAERLNHSLSINAAVHFVSAEPLLGPLDLRPWMNIASCGPRNQLDWVIVGGESGAKYRLMDHEWARSLRDQCQTHGVAFFFKQSSHFFTERGIELDGQIIRQFPSPQPALA